MFFLVKCSLHMLSFLWKAADVLLRVSRWKNKLKHHRFDRKKECTEPMKKSCLIAVITALAAVAGALAAAAVYLHRREKELDEDERLLFGEDGSCRRGTCRGCCRINQTPDTKEAHRQSDHRLRGCAFLLHKRRRT